MESPKLYIVPTPIGNLEDITLRAIRILKEVSLVLAEDMRKTGFLLKHLQISKPLLSYHKFNEHNAVLGVVKKIAEGQTIALVTDAGTPSISDPGFLLIRTCLEHEIAIETLPGPTAFIPALVNSGLPTDRFVFEGFLPHKKGRQARITALIEETRTMIFYESPHRLLKTLAHFALAFGQKRKAAVSREISKIYEENITATIEELTAYYAKKGVKGEIVLLVAGKPKNL